MSMKIDRFRWDGDKFVGRGATHEGAVDGLTRAAEHLLNESDKGVPYSEGMLAASGQTDVDEAALAASVSYDQPYALRQHEDTRLRHLNGRRAKYLQLALQESERELLGLLAAGLRGVFAKMRP